MYYTVKKKKKESGSCRCFQALWACTKVFSVRSPLPRGAANGRNKDGSLFRPPCVCRRKSKHVARRTERGDTKSARLARFERISEWSSNCLEGRKAHAYCGDKVKEMFISVNLVEGALRAKDSKASFSPRCASTSSLIWARDMC